MKKSSWSKCCGKQWIGFDHFDICLFFHSFVCYRGPPRPAHQLEPWMNILRCKVWVYLFFSLIFFSLAAFHSFFDKMNHPATSKKHPSLKPRNATNNVDSLSHATSNGQSGKRAADNTWRSGNGAESRELAKYDINKWIWILCADQSSV